MALELEEYQFKGNRLNLIFTAASSKTLAQLEHPEISKHVNTAISFKTVMIVRLINELPALSAILMNIIRHENEKTRTQGYDSNPELTQQFHDLVVRKAKGVDIKK